MNVHCIHLPVILMRTLRGGREKEEYSVSDSQVHRLRGPASVSRTDSTNIEEHPKLLYNHPRDCTPRVERSILSKRPCEWKLPPLHPPRLSSPPLASLPLATHSHSSPWLPALPPACPHRLRLPHYPSISSLSSSPTSTDTPSSTSASSHRGTTRRSGTCTAPPPSPSPPRRRIAQRRPRASRASSPPTAASSSCIARLRRDLT